MALSKAELRDRFIGAIVGSGATVSFLGNPSEHPFELLIKQQNRVDAVRLYIWNITHGGKTRSADEFRIQITGVDQIKNTPGAKTLLLGYHEGNDTFAGWDASRHSGPVSASPSLQITEGYLNAANVKGIDLYPKSNEEVVVAFSPQFASEYVADIYTLHNSVAAVDQQAIATVTATEESKALPEPQASSEERKREIQTFAKLYRATDFRKRVLAAYRDTCAVCGTQLQLVEAAHLIPVSYPGSTDMTSNGLCLCASHHTAFDQGTIAIDEDYRVLVSQARVDGLRGGKLNGGETAFLSNLRTQAIVPAEAHLRPTAEIIAKAREARNVGIVGLVPAGDIR